MEGDRMTLSTRPTPIGIGPDRDPVSPVRWRFTVWMTWRQHRLAIVTVLTVAAAAALALAVTGARMRASLNAIGIGSCFTTIDYHTDPRGVECLTLINNFLSSRPASLTQYVTVGLHLFPLLIGVFIGAPLVARELETNTFRFAWTQSIGRTRWLVGQLAWLGALVTVAALGLGTLFEWWYAPFESMDARGGRWAGQTFDLGGPVLSAWTLLGLALGVCAGVLIRRTVAAMALTTVVLGACAIAVPLLIRPRLLAAGRVTTAVPYQQGQPGGTGDLVYTTWIQGADGRPLTADRLNDVYQAIDAMTAPQANVWLAAHGDSVMQTYQPAARFMTLQLVEAAGLGLTALALFAVAVLVLRRRGA
jgi:hypothetical protein